MQGFCRESGAVGNTHLPGLGTSISDPVRLQTAPTGSGRFGNFLVKSGAVTNSAYLGWRKSGTGADFVGGGGGSVRKLWLCEKNCCAFFCFLV